MPTKKKKPKTTKEQERDVIYDEVTVRLCIDENPLTLEQAKKLLGWQEEVPGESFGTDYLIKDENGNKIRCLHNLRNRPLYPRAIAMLKNEILKEGLNRHTNWEFNGEPIIIGKTGTVLNGQHSLIALVLACQTWHKEKNSWSNWKQEPTIDKLVVFGVSEEDRVVNTMDTCKPRSLSDVLYRSEYFKEVKPNERKLVSRICSYAIRTVWERIGASQAFSPFMTHSETMQFLELHPRIVEAAHFIFVENGQENSIGRFTQSPGYAAGMLYLMASSSSDPEVYRKDPQELSLDFSNWEKAEEFFVNVSSGSKQFSSLRVALKQMLESGGGSRHERLALLAKAWTQWITKGKLGEIQLRYSVDEGVKTLAETPSVGGIDLLEP